MTLTSNGLIEDVKVKRGTEAIQKSFLVVTTARLNKIAPQSSPSFVLGTYLRSKYLYNAILLKDVIKVENIDI